MPQTRMIAIKAGQSQALATFDPPTLKAGVGDQINWQNNTSMAHWPAPQNLPKNTWMDAPIPGKLPDQPAPTSQQTLTFSGATTVVYVCALHPEETGTIVIA